MSALVQKHAPTHDVCAMNNVLCSRCILVALLYCYCQYVPVVPHVFQQYQYITTAPKTCTVYYILYYGSTVNIILHYGSLKVPGIVPHGVWNPSMVNGIIFPSPALNYTCRYYVVSSYRTKHCGCTRRNPATGSTVHVCKRYSRMYLYSEYHIRDPSKRRGHILPGGSGTSTFGTIFLPCSRFFPLPFHFVPRFVT